MKLRTPRALTENSPDTSCGRTASNTSLSHSATPPRIGTATPSVNVKPLMSIVTVPGPGSRRPPPDASRHAFCAGFSVVPASIASEEDMFIDAAHSSVAPDLTVSG